MYKNKIEDFRAKYPRIAKMTVAEVVNSDEFSGIDSVIDKNMQLLYNHKNAFHSLLKNGYFEKEIFKKEYIACLDKESKLSSIKRAIILFIGNEVYNRTIAKMMDSYDAIQSEEATENLEKLSL